MNPGARHFCTYFDRRYLPRGLVLLQSLERHTGSFILWVLCMDAETYSVLGGLGRENLRLIRLEELERADPGLVAAKAGRSQVEYYFTCTSCYIRHLLGQVPRNEVLTYVDADMMFFSSPDPIYAALGEGSIGITPHRFTPELKHLEIYGLYNVGVVCFRNDARGRACLDWWRERCLEWCFDRLEDGRFGDQKYLDEWPARFPGVVILAHPGVNLGLWNVEDFQPGGQIVVFHYHGVRRKRSWLFSIALAEFRIRRTRQIVRELFIPYLRALLAAEKTLGNAASTVRAKAASVQNVSPGQKRAGSIARIFRGEFVVSLSGRLLWFAIR